MKRGKKTMTQRTLNAMETKNTLFSVALSLFARYGFENVTVDEVTRKAGVSKGTFYTHFETKESVLVEQFHMIDQHYDEILQTIPEDASAGDRLLLLIGAMTYYCANVCGIEVMRVVYASQINASRTVKILNNKDRKLYIHLGEIVAQGRKTGEFLTAMPDDEVVEWLMRSARGLIYDWCLYNNEMDLEVEGRKYFKAILKLLSLPKPEDGAE